MLYKSHLANRYSVFYNKHIEKQYFIIDFDSTFVTVEALDELARIALKENPHREELASQIAKITKEGMEGKIDFPTSLRKRLSLFKPKEKHIQELITFLQKHISSSVERNRQFFKDFADRIYIITGGFSEYVYPVVKDFGITKNHVLANKFIYDKKRNITGFDKKTPLAKHLGKPAAVNSLNLKGKIFVIGDGITDYQIVEQNAADTFFAFTENVSRKGVVAKAEKVIKNFDELLYLLSLPRSTSFPKSKMKVLLLENISKEAYDRFIKEGYDVELLKEALGEKDLIQKIEDISVLGIRSKTEISQNVLDHAKKLLTIGSFAIGTNQIDLTIATKKGVAVFNAPYSNTRSVVELVLGEIIMLQRKVQEKSMKMHEGIWDKSAADSFEVRGKKLGIIGYGNIGSQLSVLAENLGMQVYFYDVVDKLTIGNAKKCQTLEEVLQIADIISLHVDGSKTNKNLIGEKEFEHMKDGVIFINAARGHIVDTDALTKYVKSKKIRAAALDVFPLEPKSNKEKFVHPLIGLKNVILTPHIGGSTEEAQKNIGEFVSNKLMQFVDTGNTLLSVNFPNIILPPQLNSHRIMHIHKNVPGMLAKINTIFSESSANIVGQYLKTNDLIGYVITDIDKNYDKTLTKKLRSIVDTIKVRELY